MPENSCWPILAGAPGSFFQARKPHTGALPQAEKRSFADPSSRIHIPVTSPAIAAGADAATIVRATSKARVIYLSLENQSLREKALKSQSSRNQCDALSDSTQSGLYPPSSAAAVEGGVKTST